MSPASPSLRPRPSPRQQVGSSEEKARLEMRHLLEGLLMREPRAETPAASFTCVLERTSQAMLVRTIGEVDLATIPMLWSNLKAMVEDDLNVVVDLNGIQYIDSAGIYALLDANQLFIRCGQRLVLAEPSPIFRMLLGEIAGLEQTIPVFTSVAAALASFRPPAELLPGPRSRPVQAVPNLKAV